MTRISSPQRLLGTTVAMFALAACNPTPRGAELPAVMERWKPNYSGVCSSWITSHVSGNMYCASPKVALPEYKAQALEGKPKYDETKVDLASLMKSGEQVYNNICAACHQANGEGLVGQFPPLKGSGEYYGDAQKHARIVVHGLAGEIVVQGVTYNGAMAAQGSLSDYEIAAAVTYERNSWGNADGIVLPSDVKAVR